MEDSKDLHPNDILGKRVVDGVTVFSGTVTSIVFSMHSPTLAHVESAQDSRWIEITRLELDIHRR